MLSTAEHIKQICATFVQSLGIDDSENLFFEVDITKDMTKGDLYTNLPFVLSKKLTKSPIAIAIDLHTYLENNLDRVQVEKVEVAGGYVNFWVNSALKEIPQIITHPDFTGKKLIFDYTDPNPMKEFHIGHLMSNTIGESVVRLAELGGAEVKRYSYQGDVGRHIATTIWGLQFTEGNWPDDEKISLTDKVKYLGAAYVAGNTRLTTLKEKGENSAEYLAALQEINDVNKQIYDRSDAEINKVYDEGREWSLEKFEELYKILGTKFDFYFFESKSGPLGIEMVKAHPEIFVVGEEGAIIFEGEKYGLHTRVFINKFGLPTYEGKEMALIKMKWDVWPFDRSYVITGNEQDTAFHVTTKAAALIMPETEGKVFHIGHGMMKFAGAVKKISSRTGNITAGDVLVEQMTQASFEKMKERPIDEDKKHDIGEAVGVAAIKFTILKQNIRKDIIFDPEKALALEGDSGPYVQYTAVRIKSLLRKAEEALKSGATPTTETAIVPEAMMLQRTLMRFEHACFQAIGEMAPQHVAQYLIELTSRFNSFYTNTKIMHTDEAGKITVNTQLVEICKATLVVIERGLQTLGIRTIEQM
ncbi:MAG: arginyl-tRNA synthetase [Candidatus Parcubacteria bacterium]|jgi:arginyl-tRNA synthetase